MPTPKQITAARTLLESAGWTCLPPVDTAAIIAARKPVGRPRKADAQIRKLRGPEDKPLLTMDEIASIVGCSVSTVHASLNRTSQ